MKSVITLFALITVIVYLAKMIMKLYGALKNILTINEPKAAMPSQEEQK